MFFSKNIVELVEVWEKYYAWSPYQYSMNNPIGYIFRLTLSLCRNSKIEL